MSVKNRYKLIAVIFCQKKLDEITAVLDSCGIESISEGSVGYGLEVPSKHVEDTIECIVLEGLDGPLVDFREPYLDLVKKAKKNHQS